MDNVSIPRSLITSAKSLPYKGTFTGARDQDVYIFWGTFPAYHMTSSWVSYEYWWALHMQSHCLLRPLLSAFQYPVCVPDGPLLYALLHFLDQSYNITYRKLVIDASAAIQALNEALTSSFSCSAYFFFGIAQNLQLHLWSPSGSRSIPGSSPGHSQVLRNFGKLWLV